MPPRRKAPRKTYHHGDLRNALLKAAREVLEERGPSHLGLREVSRRCGVSAPSAYHHFPSRDALALGLAEQGAIEMAQCLLVTPGTGNLALLPYGEAYVAFAQANPALYRLMFGEGFPEVSRASGAVRELRQRTFEIMKLSLQARLPEAQIPIAALFLWSLVHGLGLLLIDGQVETSPTPKDLVHQVLKLAGTGLNETRA